MDRRIRLGLGLRRFISEVRAEITPGDLDRASDLLRDMWRCDALRLGPASYYVLDLTAARRTVRRWLRADEAQTILDACHDLDGSLRELFWIWVEADVPIARHRSELLLERWMGAQGAAGLVKAGTRTWRPSMRLRLALWLKDPENDCPLELPLAALLPLRRALRSLRCSGLWHDAARLADSMVRRQPAAALRLPTLSVTAALGFVQAQDYECAGRHIETVLARWEDRASSGQRRWISRLGALDAFLAVERGDLLSAKRAMESSRMNAQPPDRRMWASLARTWLDIRRGRYVRALRVLERLKSRRPQTLEWLDAVIDGWMATSHYFLENFERSAQLFEAALIAATRAGWRDRVRIALRNLALAEVDLGGREQPERLLAGLLRRHEDRGDFHILPGIWVEIARVHAIGTARAEYHARAVHRAHQLSLQTGSWQQVPWVYAQLGYLARAHGRGLEAINYYREMAALCERVGQPFLAGTAHWQLAWLDYGVGRVGEAFDHLDRAEDVFDQMGQTTRLADVYRRRADLLLDQGDLDRAEHQIRAAEALYSQVPGAREARELPLFRLEARLRRDPGSFDESQLAGISEHETESPWYAARAYVLMSVAFAVLDDPLSWRRYAREAIRQISRVGDPFFNQRMLNLARSVKKPSPSLIELISYWAATFTLPDRIL